MRLVILCLFAITGCERGDEGGRGAYDTSETTQREPGPTTTTPGSGTGTRTSPDTASGGQTGTTPGQTGTGSQAAQGQTGQPGQGQMGQPGQGQMGQPGQGQTGQPGQGQPGQAQSMTSAQVLEVLRVANQGEIEQGQLAKQKASSPQVRNFAEMMIREHTSALQKGTDVARRMNVTPAGHDMSRQIEQNGRSILESLRALEGEEFDRQYMTKQVQMHRDLLRHIDDHLRAAAANEAQLRAFVDEIRGAVTRHLRHAETLQGRLASR